MPQDTHVSVHLRAEREAHVDALYTRMQAAVAAAHHSPEQRLPPLIGVCGRKYSGKDTIGAYLVSYYAYKSYAFADDLKEVARRIGWDGNKDDVGRALLQNLGSAVRDVIDENTWINNVQKQIVAEQGEQESLWLACVTDVRQPNEVEWVHSHGGIVWRVTRPDIDRNHTLDQHETEKYIETLDADVDILNGGTLADLYTSVKLWVHA